MRPYPEWFHILAWVSLIAAFVCAFIILVDEMRRSQKMWIMNLVWPITALYWGPVGLWAYFRIARKTTREHYQQRMANTSQQKMEQGKRALAAQPPTTTQIAVAVSHCGAGCTLGDIAGEWWIYAMALSFAGGEFQTRLLLDFLLAWAFGVVFQYFTIAPMRGLGLGAGIAAALKADALSLTAWQIGMYGFMVLAQFLYFQPALGKPAEVNSPEFWFAMQIAMLAGFVTSYPINWWLIRAGIKEKM
jgi:hypothetical protein